MTTAVLTNNVRVAPARRNILEGIVLGIVLTGLSYLVGLLAGWISEVNWLEVFAVFTSYAATYLSVRERRNYYLWGIVSTAAYCVLFIQFNLLASAVVNAYLVPTLIYGYFRWGKDINARPVRHVQLKWVPVYLAVTAAVYFGAVWIINYFNGTFATLDAVILVGTILAQFLLDNKRLETWIVWAVVNVVAIYVYFSNDLELAGFQYIFFLLNTVYGWIVWRNSMRTSATPLQPAAAAVAD